MTKLNLLRWRLDVRPTTRVAYVWMTYATPAGPWTVRMPWTAATIQAVFKKAAERAKKNYRIFCANWRNSPLPLDWRYQLHSDLVKIERAIELRRITEGGPDVL